MFELTGEKKEGWLAIGTWRMCKEGFSKYAEQIDEGMRACDYMPELIKEVEDYPYYKSVGYGGLPDEDGLVKLDAAYMNGDSLNFGAVASVSGFANPIYIAKRLSYENYNNFLVGIGAEEYAIKNGFEQKNMLTERAKKQWMIKKQEIDATGLEVSDGHDTVGMVSIDRHGSIVAATSTSGLFMKKNGRVGDSPVIGCGLYSDSNIGASTATGLGEECDTFLA